MNFHRQILLCCLASVLCWYLPATYASSLFDGKAANVWILDKSSGEIISTFAVGSVAGTEWSETAFQLSPEAVLILYNNQNDNQVLANLNLTDQEVLVNATHNSLPVLEDGLPPVSLAGIDLPLAEVEATVPGVVIEPASGTYNQTIAVRLKAVAARAGFSPLTLSWRVNNGTIESKSFATADAELTQTLYFVANGTYNVEYWVTQSGVSSTPNPKAAMFTINSDDPLQRDSDGDQIPDLVEIALGLDPLVNDYKQDSDNDGWSDFLELFLGSDPFDPLSLPALPPEESGAAGFTTLDSDGDGVPDKFEELRGTDKLDANDYPVSRRPFEVEYVINGSIYQDREETLKLTDMGELTARDVAWNSLYNQAELTGAAQLTADTALAAGDLPLDIRVPAGNPLILRARQLVGITDKWVVKEWVDSSPDLRPEDAASWSQNHGNPAWTTAAQWLTAFEEYLGAMLVQERQVTLSPASGLGVALVEGVVAWYAGLTDGALVLLGHDSHPTPKDAVTALMNNLSDQGRSFNSLYADLSALAVPGRELAVFAASVNGYYIDPAGIVESTTTREAAALVQGNRRDTRASYLARLLAIMPLAAIDALDFNARILLFDPDQDADGDGLTNAQELDGGVGDFTRPDQRDSDGDGLDDGIDPCPTDTDNRCQWQDDQQKDTDGDGIVDSIDNCMHVYNPDQADINGDGIGDACSLYANIKSPASDVTIWAGDEIDFTSLVTEHGTGLNLNYAWSFDGGVPDSNLPDPGLLQFNMPGQYSVRLVVTDTLTNQTLGEDYRTVRVLGLPLFTVGTSAPAVAGSFTPVSQLVEYNQTASLSVFAKRGYAIETVTGCGGVWTGTNPYITGTVKADCVVSATFVEDATSGCTFFVFKAKNGNTVVICQ